MDGRSKSDPDVTGSDGKWGKRADKEGKREPNEKGSEGFNGEIEERESEEEEGKGDGDDDSGSI